MLENKSIQEYFREVVKDAIRNHDLDIYESTEFYIVNLLTEYTRTENFYASTKDGSFAEEPLALVLVKALGSDLGERILLLRKVGDVSLFISGFFSDSLNRKVVDIDYYISMGENAYGHLSHLVRARTPENQLSTVFNELSKKFIPFVEVLSEVSEQNSITSMDDIMRLYEKWLKTKGKRYAKLLREKGILPIPGHTMTNPH